MVAKVCVLGYTTIGLALFLSVQTKNVFPQLLLTRLLFSIGGAATSTMITAILPSMVSEHQGRTKLLPITQPSTNNDGMSPSICSEVTFSAQRLQHRPSSEKLTSTSPTRLAGIVGVFTGCGALLALGLFLRLPEFIQRTGKESGQALADSYYTIGGLALALAVVCFAGLQGLRGEEGKGWRMLLGGCRKEQASNKPLELINLKSFFSSVALGFTKPLLGLGYLGGFVARAASVGISLFIPLFVNASYISSGLCDERGQNSQGIKDSCKGAYILAAKLTGVSQLVALLFAPVFGFLADRYDRHNAPLLMAAVLGILGYIGLAVSGSPISDGEHGSPWIYYIMALLGLNQIGAIVCSLGLLGRCILGTEMQDVFPKTEGLGATSPDDRDSNNDGSTGSRNDPNEDDAEVDSEELTLIAVKNSPRANLKGSIAGVYSLTGGVGILLLTKLGGFLFDRLSFSAPFYMLASFNAFLLLAGIANTKLTA